MEEQENFFDFIEEVLDSADFNGYMVLDYYPERIKPVDPETKHWEEIWAETDPSQKHWKKALTSADECFAEWLWAVEGSPPVGAGVRDYLCLRERRPGGSIRFHVLIANWEGDEYTWAYRWEEISRGWAFSREIGERIGGLLGYLVMRAGCSLEVECRGFPRRLYRAADFRP